MTDDAGRVRALIDAVGGRDLSVADEVFAQGCIVHITGQPPLVGVEAWKRHAAAILVAFPDVRFTVDETVSSGGLVATRWHAHATHGGPLGPVAATGNAVSIDGLILDHFVDGKISVRWEQYDQSLLLQQIGVQ